MTFTDEQKALIKQLHFYTNIGVMESKKILIEFDFDYEKALHYVKTEWSPIRTI